MSAQRALFDLSAEAAEFRCPLSVEVSGLCHLFEAAVGPDESTPRITCRYLLRRIEFRCMLGDAKTRRDHLA